MMVRYQRAARDGVATRNLRLLAKIIRGCIDAEDATADRCIYFLDILSEMTAEEIQLVWLLHEAQHRVPDKVANYTLANEIVPRVYKKKDDLHAALARLSRTGLVEICVPFGGIGFVVSSLYDELLLLVDLVQWLQTYGDEAI